MRLNNQNIEWELCKAYFSILEINMSSEVSLEQLITTAKISREEVEKKVPKNLKDYKIFFFKNSYLKT